MITITSKNIYYNEIPVSTLSTLDNVELVDIHNIISYLSTEVELGESVTFKRLIEIVSCNFDKFNDIFYSALGGHSLQPFLQEIENNPTEIFESEYLEVHWFCDKYEDDLNIYPSLHGVSTKTSDNYVIDFISLNNLKNLVVKINKSVDLFDYNKFTKNEIVDNDLKDISNDEKLVKTNLGNKAFTLFDLYNAIFYEISFHGGPQDKNERFHELEESMDEVRDLEKLDTDKLTTFEDLLKELDEKDIYLVKYEDARDRVEERRVTNEKNLPKLKNCLIEKLKIHGAIQSSDEDLKKYYKKLTDIEYNMQILYGEEEDISYHRFWETPKCTCPKIDNLENYPSNKPIFDDKCPIHGK